MRSAVALKAPSSATSSAIGYRPQLRHDSSDESLPALGILTCLCRCLEFDFYLKLGVWILNLPLQGGVVAGLFLSHGTLTGVEDLPEGSGNPCFVHVRLNSLNAIPSLSVAGDLALAIQDNQGGHDLDFIVASYFTSSIIQRGQGVAILQ